MEYAIYRPDELAHHGIKGMRWGVRRYQNKDGSLTPAGEKRRAKLQGKIDKIEGKTGLKGNSGAKYSQDNVKKKVSDMTNDELTRAINRARMEDEYNRLRPQAEKRPFMKKAINEMLVPAAINSGKRFIENTLNKAADKVLADKLDPNSYEALKKKYDKMDIENKIDKLLNPDKYLSEEDKSKRQKREFEAEDRDAQKRGYKDAIDEANQKREAGKGKKTEDSAGSKSPNNDKTKTDSDNKSATESKSENTAKRKTSETVIDVDDYEFIPNSKSTPRYTGKVTVETGKRKANGVIIDVGDESVSNLPAVYRTSGQNVISGLLEEPKK